MTKKIPVRVVFEERYDELQLRFESKVAPQDRFTGYIILRPDASYTLEACPEGATELVMHSEGASTATWLRFVFPGEPPAPPWYDAVDATLLVPTGIAAIEWLSGRSMEKEGDD